MKVLDQAESCAIVRRRPTMFNLLFVDDDPGLLEGLEQIFGHRHPDWRMHFAKGVDEAKAAMQAIDFDVVVSDLTMPTGGGDEVLEQVRRRRPAALRMILSGETEIPRSPRTLGVAHQYLTKPFSIDDLEERLVRVRDLCLRMNDRRLRALVGAVAALPSPPKIYFRLREVCARAEVSLVDVVELLEKDPAATASVLRLANSCFFGPGRRVTTLDDAVQLLGVNTVSAVVLTSAMFSTCDPRFVERCHLNELWEHSLRVSTYAGTIAHAAGARGAAVEEARVAGLLHDIGMLLLAVVLDEQYVALLRQSMSEKRMLSDIEQEMFQTTHASAGAYLIGLWGLPIEIIGAVANHHRPGEGRERGFGTTAIVHLADSIATRLHPESLIGLESPLDTDCLDRLGIGAEKIQDWQEECRLVSVGADR